MRSARSCEVSLNGADCEHPPNLDEEPGSDPPVRTRCYRCGGAACRACSTVKVTQHPAGRRIRICRDCDEEETKP